jgi:hypothetical protein
MPVSEVIKLEWADTVWASDMTDLPYIYVLDIGRRNAISKSIAIRIR